MKNFNDETSTLLAQRFKKSFDVYFNAPLDAWISFAAFCKPVSFMKDEVIKEEETTEKYFYFILEGSAGIFLWKENNFVCLDFAFENNFCCDYMSLIIKGPTPLRLVALEKSEMVRISSDDFYKLGQTSIGQTILQISAETSFVDKQRQQIELLTKTAEERYGILSTRFPNIEHRIAQKHLASYLGITPQSLSRIRKIY